MDVAEQQLEQIQDTLTEQHLEHEIEQVQEEVSEEIEELTEQVQDLVEQVENAEPDVIVQDFSTYSEPIDYERIADMVAERLRPQEDAPEDEPEVEAEHSEPPEDEPPNSSSFLYKKRV